jgi:hypothetical protein
MIRSFIGITAKAIMYRSISIIYDGTDKEFERIMPRTELLDRYELAECEDVWQRMSSRFTETLRNQKPLRPYYENKRVDGRILYTKRLIIAPKNIKGYL